MGSCNYSHKLNGRAGDGVLGISGEGTGGRRGAGRRGCKKGRGSAEEKRGVRGREVKKEELLVGGSFLVFSLLFSLLWVCIM